VLNRLICAVKRARCWLVLVEVDAARTAAAS